MRELLRRIAYLWNRRRLEREMAEEMAYHRELLSPERRTEFGSDLRLREDAREVWGWAWLFAFGQDLRYAARLLRKNAALTVTAVLSLALGIGATTSVFGVLNAILLRPLPVADPGRLVIVQPMKTGKRWILFNPLFEGLRAKQQVLEGMFAASDEPYLKTRFEASPAPAYVSGSYVSGNYFTILGITPAAGRFFRDDEDRMPGEPGNAGCPAVISFRLAGEHPAALGRGVRVRDLECTIVGIAPRNFQSHLQGYAVDIWIPMRQGIETRLLGNHGLAFFSGVMGRLRPGVSPPQAADALTALYRQLQAAEPPPRRGRPISPADVSIALPSGSHGLETVARNFAEPLKVILALAAIVLAIASFNTANLLMARGATRAGEFAARAALGAGRGRLIRQLATEAAVLAIAGGVLGALLAIALTPLLAARISLEWLNLTIDTTPDLRVAGIAAAATALAAILGGLLPALRLSGATLNANLAGAGRTTGGRSARRIAGSLVVVQLALSLVLLSATGLLLRTMTRIAAIDPGFRPDHVVAIDFRDEGPKASNEELAALYRTVDQRFQAIPGVESASLSWLGLFGGSDLNLGVFDPVRPTDKRSAHVDYVSARYFETAGMRILRGRGFTDSDLQGAPRVAVVNEALVRQRFAGSDALGNRLAIEITGEEDKPFTIVGVAADSKYNDLRERTTEPMMWMPMQQAVYRPKFAMLRVHAGGEAEAARQARRVLAASAPLLMIQKITTLSAQVDGATGRERLLLGIAAAFAWLALVMAAIGLYGTIACAVAQRTREIGVRIALGAAPAGVLRSIVGGALVYVAWAVAIGFPLAWLVGWALRGFLFGVEPLDATALAGACAVLLAAASIAAYLPARRAAHIDPITALRYE